MDRKLFVFIVLATIITVLIWIGGEVLIIWVLKLGGKASVVWSIVAVVGLISLNIWRSVRKDNDHNKRNW